MKQVSIDCCEKCPNEDWGICFLENRKVPDHGIPGWCPLPDVDGPLRTTKDKLIFWIDIQMRELAKQDLYKGGMNAGYAIAITLIKQKLEDGEFD